MVTGASCCVQTPTDCICLGSQVHKEVCTFSMMKTVLQPKDSNSLHMGACPMQLLQESQLLLRAMQTTGQAANRSRV